MSRDEARSHFSQSGLTYEDLTRDHIDSLKAILQKHLEERNERLPDSRMYINKRNKKSIFAKGKLTGCGITMRCHYFRSREAITFATSGFIGFAGWADDTNVAPLLSGFREWVDSLLGEKGEGQG